MTKSKKIILIGYSGCQLLDLTGPASVFSTANKVAGENIYSVLIASPAGGSVETDSGVTLQSQPLREIEPTFMDTILVAGADTCPLSHALKNKILLSWLVSKETTVARLSSVCSGSFILARAGLLKERTATTHWLGCDRLAQDYPDIQVDKDALFVKDGKVWTSAGVTTGIDMALVMVEEDLSAQIANDIARRLVLYARRPGHQSQFSSLLQAQSKAGEVFRPLIDWMKSNLEKSLDIPQLAERACMSERSFYRHFTDQLGVTPAQFVLSLRLEAARCLIAEKKSLKQVAAEVGFGSVPRMSAAFEKRFGMRAALFRSLHSTERSKEKGD